MIEERTHYLVQCDSRGWKSGIERPCGEFLTAVQIGHEGNSGDVPSCFDSHEEAVAAALAAGWEFCRKTGGMICTSCLETG